LLLLPRNQFHPQKKLIHSNTYRCCEQLPRPSYGTGCIHSLMQANNPFFEVTVSRIELGIIVWWVATPPQAVSKTVLTTERRWGTVESYHVPNYR